MKPRSSDSSLKVIVFTIAAGLLVALCAWLFVVRYSQHVRYGHVIDKIYLARDVKYTASTSYSMMDIPVPIGEKFSIVVGGYDKSGDYITEIIEVQEQRWWDISVGSYYDSELEKWYFKSEEKAR